MTNHEANTIPAEILKLIGPPQTREGKVRIRRQRLTTKEVDLRLAAVSGPIADGATDEAIAGHVGVSLADVKRWRVRQGSPPGPNVGRALAEAMTLFGEPGDVLHRAEESHVGGLFEIPQYVLRIPLEYRGFAKYVHLLATEHGIAAGELAASFGVREEDVRHAIILWEHRTC